MTPHPVFLASWLKIGMLAGAIGLAVCAVAVAGLIVVLASRRGAQAAAGRAQAAGSIERLGLGLDGMERRLANIETIVMRDGAPGNEPNGPDGFGGQGGQR